MRVQAQLWIAVWALAALGGCGTPGAPTPPSLELPRAPTDVTASRKGNQVTISWTPPRRTTDDQNVRFKKLGPMLVCRDIDDFPMIGCPQRVGQVLPTRLAKAAKGHRPPAPDRVAFTDTLPGYLQQQHPFGSATYAVQATSWLGRNAGLSNQVLVPLAPTLPPPSAVKAEVTAEGVVVTFDCAGNVPPRPGLEYQCRLYRQEEDSAASVVVGTTGGPHACGGSPGSSNFCQLTDHSFEWEKTYRYRVAVVTGVVAKGNKVAEVEGEDSPPGTVFTHDVFTPVAPQGLEAVASGVGQKPFIDLAWTPSTIPDLAGYNVYRLDTSSGRWIRLNAGLISIPTFRDEKVLPGRSYTYVVTAMNARGHESGYSAASSEAAP